MRTSAIPVACVLAGATAALMALAHAPWQHGWLAWIALAPLLVALRGVSPVRGALLGWLCGFAFFCTHTWWGLFVPGFNLANYAASHAGNALGLGVFGAAAAFAGRRWPGQVLLTLPALFALTEYGRIHAGWLAFPFGVLGYTQHGLPAAQLAAWTGVFGVSFVVALGNVALVEGLARLPAGGPLRLPRPRLASLVALAALPLLALSLPDAGSGQAGSLRVALVQPNADWTDLERGMGRDELLQRFAALTLDAAEQEPELIVWPSAAIPGALPRDADLVRLLGGLARRSSAHLFAGATAEPKLSASRRAQAAANSAFLFTPEGTISGRYDKIRLLPFDEYLPLREIVPWPAWVVPPGSVDFRAGEERRVFEVGSARVGVQICWENLFPGNVRLMAREGIELLVSMTNERFTDTRAGHEQMLVLNAFRAIENGLWVVRTAPTGISAVIDPAGQVRERLRNAEGRDLDVAAIGVFDVPLLRGGTFYQRHGDWFPAALLGMLLLLAAARGIRGGHAP